MLASVTSTLRNKSLRLSLLYHIFERTAIWAVLTLTVYLIETSALFSFCMPFYQVMAFLPAAHFFWNRWAQSVDHWWTKQAKQPTSNDKKPRQIGMDKKLL
jgi:flagellar motor switch protein FliM